jgi:hypothetical protein
MEGNCVRRVAPDPARRLDSALTLFEGPRSRGNPAISAERKHRRRAVARRHGSHTLVLADPKLKLKTHTIRVGESGQFTIVLENVPAPDNPKTFWRKRARYGT